MYHFMMSSNNDFTIAVAVAFTDKEKQFLEKSIKSAIKLNPGELLFGVDKGVDPESLSKIKEICSANNFDRWTIVEVEKSNEWNFQLANVVWHCYKQAKFDKILCYDIDTELRSNVMLGYDQVGKGNLACVSFTKKLLIRSVSDMIRYIFYRFYIMRNSFVFSGIYWIYRPYFFKNVILKDYMKIVNGIDLFLVDAILKGKTHKLLTRKEIGSNSFDLQNNDYPWRQFQIGIWYGANRSNLLEYITKKCKETNSEPSLIKKVVHSHPTLLVLLMYFLNQHPYSWKGYRWACKNNDHDAVISATKVDLSEWELLGGKYVEHLRDWKREGTGYA